MVSFKPLSVLAIFLRNRPDINKRLVCENVLSTGLMARGGITKEV